MSNLGFSRDPARRDHASFCRPALVWVNAAGAASRSGRCRIAALFIALFAGPAAATLNLDDRVACQTALEELRWSQTLWPEQNPGPKPALDEVMPTSAIRADVEDHLRMGAALETLYGDRIGAVELQAEINRMLAQTRDPERLQQLFAALNDDPERIAECIARPQLIERRLFDAYTWDTARHAPVREAAERALRNGDLKTAGADVKTRITTYLRDPDDKSDDAIEFDGKRLEIPLDADRWDERAAAVDRASASPTHLRETEYGFVHEQQRSNDGTHLTVASAVWHKVPFGEWWNTQQAIWEPVLPPSAAVPLIGKVARPMPQKNGASKYKPDDTWRVEPTAPVGRNKSTSVWTGSELLVWGGSNSDDGLMYTGLRYDPATDTWTSMSLKNAPHKREGHSAVWTGKVMIVWGGYAGNSAYTAEGATYDPVSDTWKSISETDAPVARGYHTAFWTGNSMVVWGGRAETALDSGGLYDPVADSWEAMTTTGAPMPASGYSAVWTGEKMIVWGGYDDANEVDLDTGASYDPGADTWTKTALAGAPQARSDHIAAWAGNRMVVWGGRGENNEFLNTGGRYDPDSNTWTQISGVDAPEARVYAMAVSAGDGMLVWGGLSISNGTHALASGGYYSPESDTWTAMSEINAPPARYAASAIWTGSEMIVNAGTYHFGSDSGGRYDPATDTWVQMSRGTRAPPERAGHTALWTGAEMWIWGGTDGVEYYADGGRYDPGTASWLRISSDNSSLNPGRIGHSAVWTGTEMLLWGGTDGESALRSGGRYKIAGGWGEQPIFVPNSPQGRYGHTAVWTGTRMIVWGGRDGDTIYGDGSRYSPTSDVWTATPALNAPAARYGHTAVMAGNTMILWGGRKATSNLATGARYDAIGNVWTPTNIIHCPSARQNHTAVWTGEEMLVWGGFTENGATSSGHHYNPVTDQWSAFSMDGAPTPRGFHTAVWTGDDMLVWGGFGSPPLDSGGRYDPVARTWTTISNAGAPAGRWLHTAVWSGEEMLVWGGTSDRPLNSLGAYAANDGIAPTGPIFSDGFED